MQVVFILACLAYVQCSPSFPSSPNSGNDNKDFFYPVGEPSPDTLDCRRPAKCVQMKDSNCMGVRLPYSTTTLDFVPSVDYASQEAIDVGSSFPTTLHLSNISLSLKNIITGRTAHTAKSETHPQVLVRRSSFPLLNFQAKMHKRHCRPAVPRNMQEGVQLVSNAL